ncbi:formyltetrahydrofolate deformylase [alpha proteobacterium AAP81b]|nr:formyltetrahydrofolate deformylase [alpha proteobacterium AAP81b]
MTDTARYLLTSVCPDRRGIVAAVMGFLHGEGLSIDEAHQHGTPEGQFFLRIAMSGAVGAVPDLATLAARFAPIEAEFALQAELRDLARRARVVIMVSRTGHCLHDLLHRWQAGQLPIDIPAVVSNHDDQRSFTQWCGLPFHHLPASGDRDADDDRLLALIDGLDVDLVVLARYMQILSPRLCARLAGRCINIHHGFLPSFKGARPYHQAHARGVKIIGATAHYVTTDLDEGPIIEQATQRVSHSRSPEELVTIGQEVEASVLSRAVRWHVEGRVQIAGQRTIVFD